jgi:hypothetical protein
MKMNNLPGKSASQLEKRRPSASSPHISCIFFHFLKHSDFIKPY